MRKTKILRVALMTCMLLTLSGCRMYANLDIDSNGKAIQTQKTMFTKDEVSALGEDITEMQTEVVDGVTYYIQTETSDVDFNENPTMIYKPGIFYIEENSENVDLTSYGFEAIVMTVDIKEPIVETNATSTDGTKAIFDYSKLQGKTKLYAYSVTGKVYVDSDTELPKISGVKDNGIYQTCPYIEVSDNVGVSKIVVNGVSAVRREYTSTINGKTTKVSDWADEASGNPVIKKNGKNKFEVYDLKGNKAEVTFTLDNKKPIIKGVKSNKKYKKNTKVYFKDINGIKKVTIKGKKQKLKAVKSGKYKGYSYVKLSKKGKQTIKVYDKVNNIAKITITVK